MLTRLRPDDDAPRAAYGPAFARMADVLLNDAVLHVGGRAHRITEIEFYFRGGAHVDVFAHGDPSQYRSGYWYFHKTHGAYRGGSYKGVDLTFGSAAAPGGILLRGLQALGEPFERTDGPSVTVDHILRLTASPSVRELAGRWDLHAEYPYGSFPPPLWIALAPDARPRREILASPRVGLALRTDHLAERVAFIARPYRFLSDPREIRKGRAAMIVGLHATGHALASIVARTGAAPALVARFVRAFDAGRGEDPARHVGSPPTGESLCRMLGACWAVEP